ncbi:MAG: hypothetical protein JWQ54_2701 [Mucilaginibacter sp.]|nr:hypothetical protein [Mucilaginibacter sp.]
MGTSKGMGREIAGKFELKHADSPTVFYQKFADFVK